jgi:septation ring formation regulator EzrA
MKEIAIKNIKTCETFEYLVEESSQGEKIEDGSTCTCYVAKRDRRFYLIKQFHNYSEASKDAELLNECITTIKEIYRKERLNDIENQIAIIKSQLTKEISDKTSFEETCSVLYKKTIELEKAFLKVSSLLPEVRKIYVINETQEANLVSLKTNMDTLGNSKRQLDTFIHSGTRQPYSVLREKLEELNHDYESALQSYKEFRAYLTSLKTSTAEANDLVSVYFYRSKQIETLLKETGLTEFASITMVN